MADERPCERCGGTHRITIKLPDRAGIPGPLEADEPCPKCGCFYCSGWGFVIEMPGHFQCASRKVICVKCNGTGHAREGEGK